MSYFLPSRKQTPRRQSSHRFPMQRSCTVLTIHCPGEAAYVDGSSSSTSAQQSPFNRAHSTEPLKQRCETYYFLLVYLLHGRKGALLWKPIIRDWYRLLPLWQSLTTIQDFNPFIYTAVLCQALTNCSDTIPHNTFLPLWKSFWSRRFQKTGYFPKKITLIGLSACQVNVCCNTHKRTPAVSLTSTNCMQ